MFSSHTDILMETSQPLATESFSLSWLVNRRPSFDNTEKSIMKSNKLFQDSQIFNFDIPISASSISTTLIHADELFSSGKILPIYLNRPNNASFDSSASVPSANEVKFMSKWRKATLKVFKKSVGRFFRPLCPRIGCSRKSTRVDDINRKEKEEVVNWYQQESPSHDSMNDIESTIYEAVLHCKRSNENWEREIRKGL